jgi:hypothetical protein
MSTCQSQSPQQWFVKYQQQVFSTHWRCKAVFHYLGFNLEKRVPRLSDIPARELVYLISWSVAEFQAESSEVGLANVPPILLS